MSYFKLEQESENEWELREHEVDDEEEALAAERERRVQGALEQATADRNERIRREMEDQLQKMEICSCGHYSCRMRPTFGHPVPLFKSDIEPLWPQSTRDRRALELKAGPGESN